MAAPHLKDHISDQFNKELNDLRSKVLTMGGLVEDHLIKALDALSKSDPERAEYVATNDYKVNALEVQIDEECTAVLLRRQPAAVDLRLVLAVSKTITDLERIGDEVEKVGRIALNLTTQEGPKSYYVGIISLGHHVRRLLHDVLDAFARLDSDVAFELAKQDSAIDKEHDMIMGQLVQYMSENSNSISRVLDAVMAVRAFERIGDHSINICEHLIYLVDGKDVRHTNLEDIEEELRLAREARGEEPPE